MWKHVLFIMFAISSFAQESMDDSEIVQGCTRRKTQPIDPYETEDFDNPEPDQYTDEGEYRGYDYRGVPQYNSNDEQPKHSNATTEDQAPVYPKKRQATSPR